MRHVGIKEFKDHATAMLSSGETLVIERHGRPVGFYVPIEAKDREAGREALGRLGKAVDQLLDRAGLDEDAFVVELLRDPGQ
jgi:antitoxin (DNA-binding transcriptional repressor) of toxin-antitoxin stability system